MHCNLLRGLGMPSEEGDQIAVDHHESNLSESDRALLDCAVKLGTRVSEFSRKDVVKLQTLGFTEEQILECEVVVALNNFANTLQMGLGIEPDFEPPPDFENKVHLSGGAQPPIQAGGVVHLVDTLQDTEAGLVAQAQSGKLEAFEERPVDLSHSDSNPWQPSRCAGCHAGYSLECVQAHRRIPRSLEVFDLAGEYRQEYGVSTITTRKTF